MRLLGQGFHGLPEPCGTLRHMADEVDSGGLRQRLSRQGEEALGRLAEELAANPLVTSALAGALEARERAVAAQEAAMGALGIPSAADIERLTRRVRSVSQRLEGIEDALDRVDDRMAALGGLSDRLESVAAIGAQDGVLDPLEQRLDELKADIGALREAVAPDGEQVPVSQERLVVREAEPPKPSRRRGSRS